MQCQLTNTTQHAACLLSAGQASGLTQHLEQEQLQQWLTLTSTNSNINAAMLLQNY
jgi:hypothetical protein